MRKLIVVLVIAGGAIVGQAGPAFAVASTTQQLPAAACNQGTQNAHDHIPETTGTGATTPGHGAVPGTENVTPCGHGG